MQDIDTPTRSAIKPHAPAQGGASSNPVVASNQPLAGDSYAPHALTLLSSALLAACGGGGGGTAGGGGDGGLQSAPGFNNSPQAKTDEEAARFLLQSQFASTTDDIAAVRSTNFANYLQQQFAKPINLTAWDWLESRNYGADATLNKTIYSYDIGEFSIWRDVMSAPDAMRKRIALALSEFFVVSLNSLEIDWRGYIIAAYWDILNQHAFGNFRDLLEAVTLSPAMGHFLNTRGNQKEDNKGRLPDENYAREVMQLFTIGLYELNLNGSVKIDGTGKKLETYDSDDVSQLARVFTGYDYDPAFKDKATHPNNGAPYKVWARGYARSPMTLDATKHSNLAVSFLTANISSNTAGASALKASLDTLFNHPNVGSFFGRQMIQRLVTSNPSPEYVARVASAFNNNGAGVRGDMKAVWTAILLDDEARGAASLASASFGKLREPMLRFAQWARSFGVVSKANSWKLSDLSDSSDKLGQSPMRAPSVFNYFRPGYVPPGTEMAKSEATAPEFQLVNETTTGSYLNYMQERIRLGIRVNNPTAALPEYVGGTDALDFEGDYTALLILINNSTISDAEAARVAQSLVARLNLLLVAGQLRSATGAEITNAIKAAMLQSGKRITNANTLAMDGLRRDLIAAAILMVMACPDYLIQK
jgi:uncharacterized protein (DUF1800 family)